MDERIVSKRSDRRKQMSVEAVAWALNVPIGGNAKVILIGLANHARAEFDEARPTVGTLARYANCDPRTVQRHLRTLAFEGWIEQTGWHALSGREDRRVVVWRLTGRQTAAPQNNGVTSADARGDNGGANGVTAASPEPSLTEPSKEPSFSGERAHAQLKIGGKPVKSETWRRTVAALAEFNRQANRSLLPVTGTGEPSEAAKRIYGRLSAWPNLDESAVADVIRRTLASRWWGGDPASIGVVFGPNVFEENLSREGSPTNGRHSAARSATVGRASRRTDTDYDSGIIWETEEPSE